MTSSARSSCEQARPRRCRTQASGAALQKPGGCLLLGTLSRRSLTSVNRRRQAMPIDLFLPYPDPIITPRLKSTQQRRRQRSLFDPHEKWPRRCRCRTGSPARRLASLLPAFPPSPSPVGVPPAAPVLLPHLLCPGHELHAPAPAGWWHARVPVECSNNQACYRLCAPIPCKADLPTLKCPCIVTGAGRRRGAVQQRQPTHLQGRLAAAASRPLPARLGLPPGVPGPAPAAARAPM